MGVHIVDDAFEVRFNGVGTYRIEQGERIAIRPLEGVPEETLEFYLKATPFGMMVLQRGELPLHASAVVPPGGGGALLIAGDSGAGKSTTAALLIRHGWRILNDDITRIVRVGDQLLAYPGFQSLKLGLASLPLLGLEDAGLLRTPGFKEKVYWHLAGIQTPVPVAAMVVLSAPDDPFEAPRKLGGMELLEALYAQTFRPSLVKPLGFHEAHFRGLTDFARSIPCLRVQGNRSVPTSILVETLAGLCNAPERHA